MTKKIIINLTGKNGAGKDTAARLIKELCDFTYYTKSEIISIADPIKQVCAILANESVNNYYDRNKKESLLDNLSLTRRDFMIEITKKTMEIDKDIYWKLAYDKIIKSNSDIIIIPDCRYLEWLLFLEQIKMQFCIFNIERDNCISQYTDIDISSLKECPRFQCDNNKDQYALKVQLDMILYNLINLA